MFEFIATTSLLLGLASVGMFIRAGVAAVRNRAR